MTFRALLWGRAGRMLAPVLTSVGLAACAEPPAVRVFTADALEATSGDRFRVRTAEGALATRSVREFSLAQVPAGDSLIERQDGDGVVVGGFGTVEPAANPFLGELLNTGWVAPTDDGGAVFASAVRRLVLRFEANGRLRWRSELPAPAGIEPPALVRQGSSIRPAFTELQHGIARGPDGRFYVLAGADPDSVRLDIIGEDGAFEAAKRIPRGADVLVTWKGKVTAIRPKVRAPPSNLRIAFPDLDLPALDGGAAIRLRDHAGKAVILNVWASWCAPCRKEMPVLSRFAAELDTSRVLVLGVNEDSDPDDARRFVQSIGGVAYPLAQGGGRQRERIGYRGLPYTVVLDSAHRVVAAIHGFGDSIEPIRSALETALGTAEKPGS